MMDWLSGLVGNNAAHIISFIALFVLFLAAVFVVFAVIKRMSSGTYVTKKHDSAPRLTVTDAAAVDSQRRLVLVRRDDVEHLILIGGPSDIVIEANITRYSNARSDTRKNAAQERITPTAPAIVPVARPAEPSVQAVSEVAAVDIIAATPAYIPETEAPVTPAKKTQAATTVQTTGKPADNLADNVSQPLQTHAQQVAAARQQQALQQAQRPAEAVTPKLHPVYPLGQVSRGVVAATSGLAAASNAAQQELIAAAKRNNRNATPSLDDVRPGTTMSRATPQVAHPARQAPSVSTTTPQPAAHVAAQAAKAEPQADFEIDLENAVTEALATATNTGDISFEDLLSSEMEQHFANTNKPEADAKPHGGMLDISPRK